MGSVTTVFTLPTASFGNQTSEPLHVPVAAITGGAIGGVILALFAVIGWKWWGRQIQKQQTKELQRQRARRAAAYRQAVIDSNGSINSRKLNFASGSSASLRSASVRSLHSVSSDPRRSRSPSISRPRTPSDRRVKFISPNLAGTGKPPTPPAPAPSIPPVPPLPSSISAPKPLRPVQNKSGLLASSPSPRRLSKSKRISPLGPPSFQRATLASAVVPAPKPGPETTLGTVGSATATSVPATTTMTVRNASGHTTSQKQPKKSPISSDASSAADGQEADVNRRAQVTKRLPRLNLKASLTSLSAEGHRQSRASQNTSSDRSSNRRWSWWSLLSGPGFSFGQMGIGSGKNRLSADTSLYTDWSEEDPSFPIGYAYSGFDDSANSNSAATPQRPTHTNTHFYQSLEMSDRH